MNPASVTKPNAEPDHVPLKLRWVGASFSTAPVPADRMVGIVEGRDTTFFCLANGSRTGWDTGDGTVSEFVLTELASRADYATRDDVQVAIREVEQRLIVHFPPTSARCAGATVLVGLVHANRVEVGWVGHDQALVVRAGQVRHISRPKSMASVIRAQGSGRPSESYLENLPVDTLRADRAVGEEPVITWERRAWDLQQGDRFIAVSRDLLQVVNFEEIVAIGNAPTADDVALNLIERARGRRATGGIAVLVGEATLTDP